MKHVAEGIAVNVGGKGRWKRGRTEKQRNPVEPVALRIQREKREREMTELDGGCESEMDDSLTESPLAFSLFSHSLSLTAQCHFNHSRGSCFNMAGHYWATSTWCRPTHVSSYRFYIRLVSPSAHQPDPVRCAPYLNLSKNAVSNLTVHCESCTFVITLNFVRHKR